VRLRACPSLRNPRKPSRKPGRSRPASAPEQVADAADQALQAGFLAVRLLMVARGQLGPGLVAPARRRGGIAAGFARRILVRAGQGAVATALAPATAATLLLRRVGFRCRRLHVRIRRGGHPFRYVSFRRRLPGVRLVAASATSAVAAPLVAAMGFALAGIGTAAAALTTLALAWRPVVRGAVS